jgi:hypothetical protein
MSAAPVVKPGYQLVRSGAQAVGLAEKLSDRARWPYPWEYAPPGSVPVFALGSIEAPAIGTLTVVATHIVPAGMIFCLKGVVLTASVGNAWVPGDGSIVFGIDVNRPGAGNAEGIFLKDFGNIVVPLGSFQFGPWPIPGTEMQLFEETSTIRIKVTTGAAINPGAPNFIQGALVGYDYPA